MHRYNWGCLLFFVFWLSILLISGLGHFHAIFAQPTETRSLDLEACIELGVNYSPAVRAVRGQIQNQRYQLQAAHADLIYPSISLNASLSYAGQGTFAYSYAPTMSSSTSTDLLYLDGLALSDYLTQDDVFSFINLNSRLINQYLNSSSQQNSNLTSSRRNGPLSSSLSLQIAKTIFSGYALINNRDLESLKLNVVELEYEKIIREVQRQIILSFYTVLYYKQQKTVYDYSVEVAGATLDSMKYKYEGGMINEMDYIQSQMNYRQTLPRLRASTVQLQQAKQELCTLIGFISELGNTGENIDRGENAENNGISHSVLQDLDHIEFLGALEEQAVPPEIFDIVNVFNRIEWKQQLLQRRQLIVNQDIIRSNFYPTVSIFTQGSYNFSNNFVFQNGSFGWSISGGIRIAFSLSDLIFPNNRLRSSLQASNASLQVFDANQIQRENQYKQAWKHYITAFEQSKLDLQEQKAIEQLSQQLLNISKEALAQGTISSLDFRQVEMQHIQAKIDLLSVLRNYNVSLLELKYITGLALP